MYMYTYMIDGNEIFKESAIAITVNMTVVWDRMCGLANMTSIRALTKSTRTAKGGTMKPYMGKAHSSGYSPSI